MNSHQFAFYCPELAQLVSCATVLDTVSIVHDSVVHRITQVVRLEHDDVCTLFDQTLQVTVQIVRIERNKKIILRILELLPVLPLKPVITVLLPVLKKESLEHALYSCVELGVNTIHLTMTAKTHAITLRDHDFKRMRGVMQAAAEQSKNFYLPTVLPPQPLPQVLSEVPQSATKLYGAINGHPLAQILAGNLQMHTAAHHVVVLVGPEGDFTEQEHILVQEHKYIPCKLTPTILRSQQALVLLVGFVRSCVIST